MHRDVERNLKGGNESCILLIKDAQLLTPEPEDSTSSVFCETKSGEIYNVDTEEIPNLQSGSTELMLSTETVVDSENYEIIIPKKHKPKTRSIESYYGKRQLAQTEGTLSFLVVRVVTSNASTSGSEKELSNSIFGNDESNPQIVNMKSQFESCSHGKLNVVEATDRSGNGISINNGATTVQLNLNTNVGHTKLVNAITNALNTGFSVDRPRELADHVLYCLPPGSLNGVGYAYFNSWNSVFNDDWCNMLSATMHEIGK